MTDDGMLVEASAARRLSLSSASARPSASASTCTTAYAAPTTPSGGLLYAAWYALTMSALPGNLRSAPHPGAPMVKSPSLPNAVDHAPESDARMMLSNFGLTSSS